MPLPTYTQLATALTKFFTATDKAHDIVNGPASGAGSTVSTASGDIPTHAKQAADFAATYTPLVRTTPPIQGTTVGVLGQLCIVTIAANGLKYTFRCIGNNLWEGATPGLFYNSTLSAWRITRLLGADGSEVLTIRSLDYIDA